MRLGHWVQIEKHSKEPFPPIPISSAIDLCGGGFPTISLLFQGLEIPICSTQVSSLRLVPEEAAHST